MAFQTSDIAAAPLTCRGPRELRAKLGRDTCGADLRETIAEMLNDGTLKEDGESVAYACPSCGTRQTVSRTPALEPALEPNP